MLEADSQLAVYLAHETQELLQIYESVRTATNTDLATSAAAGECAGVGCGGMVAGSLFSYYLGCILLFPEFMSSFSIIGLF